MSLDPLKATKAIEEKYLDYLETTFALNDNELHQQLVVELKKPGRFSKGPILEATPPFETGNSLLILIKEGLLSNEFTKLQVDELPLERDLYSLPHFSHLARNQPSSIQLGLAPQTHWLRRKDIVA